MNVNGTHGLPRISLGVIVSSSLIAAKLTQISSLRLNKNKQIWKDSLKPKAVVLNVFVKMFDEIEALSNAA